VTGRNEATAANYKTTSNRRARTALFEFIVEAPNRREPRR